MAQFSARHSTRRGELPASSVTQHSPATSKQPEAPTTKAELSLYIANGLDLEPLEELKAEGESLFVGRETSPPKVSNKFIVAKSTVETGCGPDDDSQAVVCVQEATP